MSLRRASEAALPRPLADPGLNHKARLLVLATFAYTTRSGACEVLLGLHFQIMKPAPQDPWASRELLQDSTANLAYAAYTARSRRNFCSAWRDSYPSPVNKV